jgi:hypothetical protein
MKSLVRQDRFVLRIGFVVIGLLVVLGAARSARADETYTFVGQPFQGFALDSDCSPTCQIMGSFTVAQPLAANLNNVNFTAESFSFTDSFYIYTNLNPTAFGFFRSFSTDSSGAIVEWDVNLEELQPPTSNPFSPTDSSLDWGYNFEFGEVDTSSSDNVFGPDGLSQSIGFTGKWTSAPGDAAVPEPGSAALVGVGFGLVMLLGAVGRRR